MTATIDQLFSEIHTSIADRSIGREPYSTTREKLQPHTEQLLEAFQQWAPDVEGLLKRLEDRRADMILIMAIADLVNERGDSLPEWFLPYVQLIPLGARFVPEDRAFELLKDLGDDALAKSIEVTFEREYFARSIAFSLISLIEDGSKFEHIVKVVSSKSSPDKMADALSHSVDRALPILRQKWKENPTNDGCMTTCLLLANMRESQEDDDLYIDGLGHRLKAIRAYAQLGLSNRGEGARTLLERGVKARRKAVREWCAAQLEVLGQTTADPATEDHFASLSEAEQEAMGERIDALYNADKKAWTKWLKSEVAADPMLWLHATLALFSKNPQFIHRWQVFKTLCTTDHTKAHHKEMWSVYLAFLAKEPRVKDSHTQWHLEKHFALVPSEYAQEIFDQALFNATAPMSVPMYVHYFTSGYCTPALLVAGLQHKSKKVRDAAIKASSKWPSSEDGEAVVALLGERKKGTRQYAGEALAKMPRESVEPHIGAIAAALDGEKVDDVKSALESVLSKYDAS